MAEAARFVLLGLAVGALYAPTAQGLVLIYRGSGVVNLAQGAFAMVGAFVYYEGINSYGWSEPVAWAAAIGIPALLSVATHLVVMRQLHRASPLVRLVSTLGVFFLLTAMAYQLWGFQSDPVRSPLPDTIYEPFGEGSTITADRLYIIGIAIVITAALFAVFRWTRFGARTEAVAENPLAASSLGISPDRTAALNWGLGAALAALNGVLIAPILFLSVAALSYTVLRGLAAALVGRFRSFWGTLLGALGIGVVESLLANYIEHDGIFKVVTDDSGLLFGQFTAASVSRSTAFLIIVVVLVVVGTALPLRHELLDRLPALGRGTIHWPGLVLAVAAATAVTLLVSDDWAIALIISMATAIVCLSVVVVTGYVGQLSLAQFALAGFGAWVGGRLAAAEGVTFLPAVVIAVAAAAPLGALVAVPALRTRGINLAVLTLGLSVVVFELVFSNGALVGGFFGTEVSPPTLFGVAIDAARYPDRYALVVLVALTVASIVVANIRRGRIGRRFIAVRGNERAAAALGIRVAGVKVFAFTVGAAIAALGGVLLAFRHDDQLRRLPPVRIDLGRRLHGHRRGRLRPWTLVRSAVRVRRHREQGRRRARSRRQRAQHHLRRLAAGDPHREPQRPRGQHRRRGAPAAREAARHEGSAAGDRDPPRASRGRDRLDLDRLVTHRAVRRCHRGRQRDVRGPSG